MRVAMRGLFLALIVVVVVLIPGASWAIERWCADNPSVCLCSAQLQMTGFTRFSDYLKPNDGSTCSTEGVSPGYAILRTADDLIGSSDATILSKFPAGHTVARVLKAPEGHTGSWNIGHMLTGSNPTARFATRWYLYYSPNFEHTDKITCLNSEKWMVGSTNFPNNPQSGFHNGGSNGAIFHLYAWPGWAPALDCCPNGGPGYNPAGPPRSLLAGRWWRYEVVVRNRSSAGLTIQAYIKNVTDNTAEVKIIDTTIPCTGCGNDPTNDWTVASGATTTLTPPAAYKETRTEHFRNGTCAGFYAVSHYAAGAWSTDSNQRIGAASEIEGGAITPPAAPTNLRLEAFAGVGGTIASSFPGDVNIETHPDVIFVDRLNQAPATVITRYEQGGSPPAVPPNTANLTSVVDAPAGSPNTNSIRMANPSATTTRLYKNLLRINPGGYTTLYARVYAKFETGGAWHHNGPWIYGQVVGAVADADFNGSLCCTLPTDNFHTTTEIQRETGYTAWPGMRTFDGTQFFGNTFLPNPGLTTNAWHCMEIGISMNSPVTSPNGTQKIWLDGTQIANFAQGSPLGSWNINAWTTGAGSTPFDGFNWRTASLPTITNFWLEHFTDAAGAVRYAHLVLATSRIGCLS